MRSAIGWAYVTRKRNGDWRMHHDSSAVHPPSHLIIHLKYYHGWCWEWMFWRHSVCACVRLVHYSNNPVVPVVGARCFPPKYLRCRSGCTWFLLTTPARRNPVVEHSQDYIFAELLRPAACHDKRISTCRYTFRKYTHLSVLVYFITFFVV